MFMNFNRFFQQYYQQSKLDTLLKQENITLETILDEEDILREIQGMGATKFAEFIIAHPVEYQKMIAYIVDDVQDGFIDRNKQIKYPFLISEVFSSENEKLINFLFEKPEETSQEEIVNPLEDAPTPPIIGQVSNTEQIRAGLLGQIFELLNKDTIVITQAGYFAKIVSGLIRKRGYDFWVYIQHQPEILGNLIKHSHIKHIADILEKLLILDTTQENQQFEYANERKILAHRLMKFMRNKLHSQSIINNLAEMFTEVIKRGTAQIETNPNLNSITKELLDPQFFFDLAYQSQLPSLYQLLVAIVECQKAWAKIQQVEFPHDYSEVIQHLHQVIVQDDYNRKCFMNSIDKNIMPLGDCKLQILVLIEQLMVIPELQEQFNGVLFDNIITLLKKHPYNNQLQLHFEKLITIVCESNNIKLQSALFEDSPLLHFIVSHNNQNSRQGNQQQNKLGYGGIFTRITNYLNNLKFFTQVLYDSLNKEPNWSEYTEYLSTINSIEQSWICGINPKQKEQPDLTFSGFAPTLPLPTQQGNVDNLYPPLEGIRKSTSSDVEPVEPVEPVDVIPIVNQQAMEELITTKIDMDNEMEESDIVECDQDFSGNWYWKMESCTKQFENQTLDEYY